MAPQSPRPREPRLPRRGGFQNFFFCQEIRWEGTTRRARSKANRGRSGGGPRSRDVLRNLRLEGVHARELSLLPEPTDEDQGDVMVVEISREIEDMSLDRDLGLPEGRPEADVHDGRVLQGADRQPGDVDPDRKPEGPVGLDVGRGEAEGPAAAGPSDHRAPDRIGTA